MTGSNERLIVIISDVEMSTGDQFDDFPHTQYLCDFITRYNHQNYLNKEIDIVFNGDTFDFLKTAVEGRFPHLIDKQMALIKFEAIANAHRDFFTSLENFINSGNRARRVHFITGNHDMELLFPEVQQKITELCGGSGQVLFPGFELNIGDLHIEHGNQIDPIFSVDPSDVFDEYRGKKILKLPWATVTLLNTILPHREDFYELDRIKPRHKVFDRLPKLKDFILSILWNYWTTDFFRSDDPLKKVSWNMLKEGFKRSLVFKPDVELEDALIARMHQDNGYRLYVVGHMHEPKLLSYGNRKMIQTGCFRDEFMLDDETDSFEVLPKNYVEVVMKNNRIVTSDIKEDYFEVDENRIPKPLASYENVIEQKLLPPEKRLKEKIAIDEQEEKEQKGS